MVPMIKEFRGVYSSGFPPPGRGKRIKEYWGLGKRINKFIHGKLDQGKYKLKR